MNAIWIGAAVVLLVVSGLLIAANWVYSVRWWTRGERGTLFLVVGGVAGFAGWTMLPGMDWRVGLLAFPADPGCFGIAGVVELLRRRSHR